MYGFVIALGFLVALFAHWHWQKKAHLKRIKAVPLRVHVNGIRGKSTVTRIVAGMLREAGYTTLGKTTGSAAKVIHHDGSETPILRWGAPTIVEQLHIVKEHVSAETNALVVECMAVNPTYQLISQHEIVHGNITVITNVREDHQDVMGESLLEIADALSSTIPQGGVLITAEDRPLLRQRLEQNAKRRNSRFIFADAEAVPDEALKGFDYLAFKENVAIGLAIADMLDIPHDVAIRGMQHAPADVGAVRVKRAEVYGKEVIWAPMFAVNDRESSIVSIEALKPYHRPDAVRIGLLNNRLDRAARALQFAEIAATDLMLDYYITLGAYEAQVTERMVALGFPRERVIHLGDSVTPTTDEMLQLLARLIDGDQGVLIGLVNIHTAQAEQLMHHFDHEHAMPLGTIPAYLIPEDDVVSAKKVVTSPLYV